MRHIRNIFVFCLISACAVLSGGWSQQGVRVGNIGLSGNTGIGAGSGVGLGGGPGCTNEINDSWQFEDAAWSGVNADITVTAGQSDPFEGTAASLLVSVNGLSNAQEVSTAVAISSANDIVSGLRIKNSNMADGQKTLHRISHSTSEFIKLIFAVAFCPL